jgi:hypothetical protein
MNNLIEREKRYLEDVDVCIRLLETLKEDYHTPSWHLTNINSNKVTRVRRMIHDLLKRY